MKPKEPTYAFALEAPTQGEIDQVKDYLFQELLPVVKALRSGQPVIQKTNPGEAYMDPRGILYFLWDDLSTNERATAAMALGYQSQVTRRQLLRGPHPGWFSKSDFQWGGTSSPIRYPPGFAIL